MTQDHLTNSDKEQSFNGLAIKYDEKRPRYPKAMGQDIVKFWSSTTKDNQKTISILDVGCGSGISTRFLKETFGQIAQVVGVEPGQDMLDTARKSSSSSIKFVEGSAENLPYPDKSIDIVATAQAIQWFDRDRFYSEAKRVLNQNGLIVIFENNRNFSVSDFLYEYESFLEEFSIDESTKHRYSRHYRANDYAKELKSNFRDTSVQSYLWQWSIPVSEFLSMAKTSTQVKRAERNIGENVSDEKILRLAQKHANPEGLVQIDYETKLYIAYQ